MLLEEIVRDNFLDEDYPVSFNMDEFKSLDSFKKRISHCEQHLTKIGAGSSRIVYKIDDEKVLKLAKNAKGISQNEVEINHSEDYYLFELGIIAKVFDYEQNMLWLEMELAEKASPMKFEKINNISFKSYCTYLDYYNSDVMGKSRYKTSVDDELKELCENNDFVSSMTNFVGNYGVPIGDLKRISSYGIVKSDNIEKTVLIDFGLNDDVYNSHYKR